MSTPKKLRSFLFTLLLILAGCSAQTVGLLPTNTPRPGPTSTFTPAPTNTPTITPTPTPPPATPTPPPAPTATPVIMDGAGDSVADITISEPVLLRIAGNTESRNFAIIAHGANHQDLLVNTLVPYTGIRPLNFQETSTRLEIKAAGNWHIEIWPLVSAHRISVPGEFKGSGDDVLFIDGAPNTATISGNQAERNFAVIGYGKTSDLLVNALDPYQGTVIVNPETLVLEVRAVGGWTIKLNP